MPESQRINPGADLREPAGSMDRYLAKRLEKAFDDSTELLSKILAFVPASALGELSTPLDRHLSRCRAIQALRPEAAQAPVANQGLTKPPQARPAPCAEGARLGDGEGPALFTWGGSDRLAISPENDQAWIDEWAERIREHHTHQDEHGKPALSARCIRDALTKGLMRGLDVAVTFAPPPPADVVRAPVDAAGAEPRERGG